MLIEILGSGCDRCRETERIARQAVRQAGITAEVVHVTDARAIAERRILSLPAVAIDGAVKLSGRVPAVPEMVSLLMGHLAAGERSGTVNYAASKGRDE